MIDQQFKNIELLVKKYWPTAGHLPENYQSLSVFDHAEQFIRANPVQETQDRRDEFRTFVASQVEKLLGKEVAESVRVQLATNHSLPTAHHTTPLSPNTLNPTLTMALAYANRPEADRKNLIVLACSGISFNNHWYPRGHIFHSLVDNQIVENQLNFFGRAADADPVITARGYNSQVQKNVMKTLLHLRSEKQIMKRELKSLTQIFEEIYFNKAVMAQDLYIDQITLTNFYAWQKLFSTYKGSMPNLIFLSQEKIAADLLREFHMKNKTILHHMLFDTAWHDLIYKYFNNIMCAFSFERQYGTFHFWYTPKGTNTRTQLFAKDGVLISPDEKIRIPLTPEAIHKALLDEDITPSVMLTFVVLSLYYGFFLTGGLDQPTYLAEIKDAHIAMLTELGLEDEVKNCLPIAPNDIIFTRPTIAFLDGPNGQRSSASILDLLVHGTPESWSTIIEASKNITVQDFLYRLYPELYRDYAENKEKELEAITEQEIEQFTGIDKKIPPWAKLTQQG